MSSHPRQGARVAAAIVLLACAPAPAPAVEPDTLAKAADALSATPREGSPTYQQTVGWLSSQVKAHSHVTFSMGGVGVATSFEVQPTHHGCVLGLLRTSRNLTSGLVVGGGYLLALHEVNRAGLQVLQVAGRAWCVDLKGTERMVLQIENAGSAREPRLGPGVPGSAIRVCFDTPESAERAAEALGHAAALCRGREPI